MTEDCRGGEELKEREKEEEWTAVLSLDHIRSRNRYIGLLEHWTQQLQLTGRLLLGRNILVILQGARSSIKVPTRMFHTASHEYSTSFNVCTGHTVWPCLMNLKIDRFCAGKHTSTHVERAMYTITT